MELSRRNILGGALGAGGLMVAQAALVPARGQEPSPDLAKPAATLENQSFSIDLLSQPDSIALDGCWLREANFKNFPVSAGVSGGVISLAPGALRELHWHAQASEWAYVISGRCRVTIIDPSGHFQTVDFAPGDIWYFPRGFGHAIQCLGDEDCVFLLAFDNGTHAEYGTFSLADWVATIPKEMLATTFDVPAATFDAFPRKNAFFSKAQSPGALPVEPTPGSLNEGALSCRYPLRAQKPSVFFPGGSQRVASSKEFPISTGMTGALLSIAPGADREPHWHPNANEWQYVVAGTARTTIFLSNSKSVTVELGAGHVAYIPRACGHFTENTGTTPLELIAVFDSGTYESIELRSWVRSNTAELLAANFHQAPATMNALLK